jgi:hypothetical protein
MNTLVNKVSFAKIDIKDPNNPIASYKTTRLEEAKSRIREYLSESENSQLTRGTKITQDRNSGTNELISYEFWMSPNLNWGDSRSVWLQEVKSGVIRATNGLWGYGDLEVSSDVLCRIRPISRTWRKLGTSSVRAGQPVLLEYAIELLGKAKTKRETSQLSISQIMSENPGEWERRFGNSCPAKSSIVTKLSEAAQSAGGWQALVSTHAIILN